MNRCPYCIKEGKTSKLYVGGTFSTLMHSSTYYDEDGILVHNDPNSHTTTYQCSNGHDFSETRCKGEITLKPPLDTDGMTVVN